MAKLSDIDMSKLKVFGMGIVVKDKPKFSDEVEVYIPEQMPYVSGKIADAKIEHKRTMVDSKGSEKTYEAEAVYTITASWLPDGNDNQITAPDVYKNETVKVFRFGDSDKFFWKTSFREPKLRKQETVATMYSNQKDPKEEFDKKSSYWTQVDTRDKKWQLHTSRNDGEKCEYDAEIDTKEGLVTIKDDLGNKFNIDSGAAKITFLNSSNNSFVMEQGNTTSTTPDALSMTSTSTSMQSSDATQIAAGSDMGINAGGGLNLSAAGDSNMNAGGTMKLAGNPIILEGDVIINGNLTVNGDITCNTLTCNFINAPGCTCCKC